MELRPRLSIRPRHINGEGRAYYLLRVAKANNLRNIIELSQRVSLTLTELMEMTDLALDQYLRGVDIRQLAPPIKQPEESLKLLREGLWSRSRVCPRCFAAGIPPKKHFQYSLSIRCEEHNIFLHNTCPKCDAEINFLRKNTYSCDCGYLYKNFPIKKAPIDVQLYETLFAPWRASHDWQDDEHHIIYKEIESAQLLNAVIAFVTSAETAGKTPWIYFKDWPTIKSILSPWPNAMIDRITSSIPTNKGDRLRWVLNKFKYRPPELFSHIKLDLEKQIQKRMERRTIDNTPMLSLRKACANIGIIRPRDQLVLFNSTYFSHKEATRGPTGIEYWVSESEAILMKNWFNETVTLERAAEMIGCKNSIIRGLARIGELEPLYFVATPKTPRFKPANIDTIIRRFDAIANPNNTTKANLVPLASICPDIQCGKAHWHSQKWARLIKLISSKAIPIYRIGDKRGWHGIGIERPTLRNYYKYYEE